MNRLLRLAIGVAILCPLLAGAQAWPNKPIRLIVPVPAGAGPDVDARQITARLTPLLGQSMFVENRPGAGTRIAIEAAAKSAPDGYTFLLATPGFVTAPSLYANLPFDGKRDLVPVSLLSTTAYALTVNAAVPAQNVAAFIALAKNNPTFAQTATYGIGTLPHLAGAWFASISGADLKFIHYNTTPPFNDLLAGQTSAIFDAMLPVIGNVKAGKLRMLAISGTKRQPMAPDVPTFAESGMAGFDPTVWVGVLAPAGTPQPIIQRMSAALAQVAKSAEIIGFRRDVGSDSVGSTPEEFGTFLDAERAKWGKVIQSMSLKLE
ncbi:MAG TPA: tripartite tricarboxylate transporter substrate-binding protein [Burkholderiales bacterium]|nr:tripartite tricarboxylate transporter substrate-binding protein [Burkholderiales bacterium]